MIDWRALLSSIRVEWIDRGHNTTPGNISINCPFCQDDPSHHLSISEYKPAYYCWRNPNQHSGANLVKLLVRLGQSRDDAVRLLNYFNTAVEKETPKKAIASDIATEWDIFDPAQDSLKCTNFLTKRGFTAPSLLCEEWDLRYAPRGEWANRLLIPLGKDRGWTGRDLSGNSELKYLTEIVAGHQPLYCPDATKPNAHTFIIVEGPLDALRIAEATRRAPFIVIALCGKSLGSSKLLAIRELTATCERGLVALDSDVKLSETTQTMNEIRGVTRADLVKAKLPTGVKDPGDLPTKDIIAWLNNQLSKPNF